MRVAIAEIYAEMLDRTLQRGCADAALDGRSSETLNAAPRGRADASRVGIRVPFQSAGAEFLLGTRVRDRRTGAAGGELYLASEDTLRTAEQLGTDGKGRSLLAATFGNVHGVS